MRNTPHTGCSRTRPGNVWYLGLCGVACLLAASCGQGPRQSSEDKPHIDALERYRPVYELDNHGRVIDLTLEGSHVDDQALDQVKQLTALRRLSLYGASVSDAGIAKLQGLSQLEALGATPLTDQALTHLKKMPGLCHLWVSKGGKISGKKLAELQKALPGLVVYQQ
jgi:hypothetical protein